MGAFKIASPRRAVVYIVICHMQATGLYFNNGGKQGKLIIFLECNADISVFLQKSKNSQRYHSSKNKKNKKTGLTQGSNLYGYSE